MVRMLADVTSTNIGVWRLEKPYPPWESPIEELFESHPDHDLFGSLPGAGPKLAPETAIENRGRIKRFSAWSVMEKRVVHHWHPNADEWAYFLKGTARVTVFDTGPAAMTADFHAGDIGYGVSPTKVRKVPQKSL